MMPSKLTSLTNCTVGICGSDLCLFALLDDVRHVTHCRTRALSGIAYITNIFFCGSSRRTKCIKVSRGGLNITAINANFKVC